MKSFSKLFDNLNLKSFEHPIYIVGGAVRDVLLGVENDDIDLASSLTPDEFKSKCKLLGYKTFDTGLNHGTVMVRINNCLYEHTTFRYDVSCDGRNATVSFANNIEDDLSRRDFTVNAMALLDENLIDPFGGKKDLAEGIIRTVGNPYERFQEDYLRIIRAARFSSNLSFRLEKNLVDAACKLSSKINEFVAMERVMQELNKSQASISLFFDNANKLGFRDLVFSFISRIPENEFHKALACTKNLGKEELYMRIFFLSKENLSEFSSHYKLSKVHKKAILYAQKYYVDLQHKNLKPLQLYSMYSNSPSLFLLLWKLVEELYSIPNELYELLPKVKEAYNNPLLDGEKLIELGVKPNQNFKGYLQESIKLQIDGFTEKEIIKEIIKN